MVEGEVIELFTQEAIAETLNRLVRLKDANSIYQYVITNEAAHKGITDYIFKDENKYKARLEEIAGMKYTFSPLFKDKDTPKMILCPIDVAKIVAVYTDYEGNNIMIEDLFNSKHIEWQKQS